MVFCSSIQFSLGYEKAIASFYPPPGDLHPTTHNIWACNSVINQNGGYGPLECNNAGIYAIFSTANEIIDGNEYMLPLYYIGRSTIDVRDRIADHSRRNHVERDFIVCYMRFPGLNDKGTSNQVTPVEQALLHQFKTQFNSWDNLGFEPEFDTAYPDENGLGWDRYPCIFL